MEPLERLFLHTKQTIADEELQQIFQESDYELFHDEVERLVKGGILVPVKSSKMNGRVPPLFTKYRIIKPPEDSSVYLESVRRLHPLLNLAGYLQRIEWISDHSKVRLQGRSRPVQMLKIELALDSGDAAGLRMKEYIEECIDKVREEARQEKVRKRSKRPSLN